MSASTGSNSAGRIKGQQEAAKAKALARKAAEEGDKMLIARHFSGPDGRKVLELLMRRFGVLGTRFVAGEDGKIDVVRAAVRDGRAQVPLFIISCLKEAGEEEVSLPL